MIEQNSFAQRIAELRAKRAANNARAKQITEREQALERRKVQLEAHFKVLENILADDERDLNKRETTVALAEQELANAEEAVVALEQSLVDDASARLDERESVVQAREAQLAEEERNLLELEEEIQPREETQPEEPESTSTQRTVIEPASNIEKAEAATPDLWTATGFDDAEAEMLPAGNPLVPFKQTEENEILPQEELVPMETLTGGQATPTPAEGTNLLAEGGDESLSDSTETDSGTKFPFWAKLLTFGVVAYATALLSTWATCNELFRTSYGCKARNVLEFNLEEKGDQEAPKTRENNDSSSTSLEPRATL